MNNIPTIIKKRNEFGLLENIDYVFNLEGEIEWRKMIKPEHLVPNKQIYERLKQPVPTSVEGLEDKFLLTLLSGSKALLSLRGFRDVSHVVTTSHPDQVVSVCHITFIPNYETEMKPVTFSAIGEATPNNTNGFGRNYLGPIAENRALVRCVRNFLRIPILSQEEIGGAQDPYSTPAPPEDSKKDFLKETMLAHNISFEMIKNALTKEGFDGAENLISTSDIPAFKAFDLIERIKKKAAEKLAKTE